MSESEITYKTVEVDSINIFYREAGSKSLPNLLLLHGHGSSSHVFQSLIPLLSSSFHILAPDFPGFGQSDLVPRDKYKYNFANIADTISRLTEVKGIDKFAVYTFDFGAPVGFYIASKHPERITGIVSQSGNTYEEGIGAGFAPVKAYWAEPSNPERREALKFIFEYSTIKWSYSHGSDAVDTINPDSGLLDLYYNNRPGALDIQLDLLLDYDNNLKAYPAWQSYLRQHRPKVVAIWGNKDPFFAAPGAEAFKRDVPDADVTIVDGGHYLMEVMPEKIAAAVKKLL